MLPIKKISILLFSVVVSLEGCYFLTSTTFTQDSADSVQIREAILDYTEGVYNVDTLRIYKSVHPDLVKRGSWYDQQKKDYTNLQEMNFKQLVDLAAHWNRDGKRAKSESVRKIEIFDVQNKTASAKLMPFGGQTISTLPKSMRNGTS